MTAAANLRAAGMMLGAIGLFGLNDMIVKLVSARLPVPEILTLRGVVMMMAVLAIMRFRGERLSVSALMDRRVLLKAVIEVGVVSGFLFGIAYLPLAVANALIFSSPIMGAILAGPLLGERVSWRRWSAVALGFAGVVLVTRPGGGGAWHWAVLLPLGSALLMALGDVVNRRIDPAIGSGTVVFAIASAVMLAGAVFAIPVWTAPPLRDLLGLGVAALFLAVGYYCYVASLRLGEISFVAPFKYAAIPFAMALGLFIWGDVSSPAMIAGAALIVAAGLAVVDDGRAPSAMATRSAGHP